MKKIILFVVIAIFLAGCSKQIIISNRKKTNKNKSRTIQKQVTHEKNEISIEVDGKINRVVYFDNEGRKRVVDEGDSFLRPFIRTKFSPRKNYIIYSDKPLKRAREEVFHLYDIANDKVIDKIYGDIVEFTPDEKYLYTFWEDYVLGKGSVYSVPDFKKVFSVHGEKTKDGKMEFNNDYRVVSCKYNKQGKKIEFRVVKTSARNLKNARIISFDVK